MRTPITNYFNHRPEIAAIYLFGSHAQGKDRKFSDVDIGILFNKIDPAHVLEKLGLYIRELGRLLRKDIHPVVLNNANENLLYQVFSKGECLVVNNPETLSKFRSNAFIKIADFAHYKERIQKGFINKLIGAANG